MLPSVVRCHQSFWIMSNLWVCNHWYVLNKLCMQMVQCLWSLDICTQSDVGSGGHFKNTYELLNLTALKFSPVNKIHIFQCMGKIFCVEFQRYPLQFHTKYLTHILKIRFLYNIEILRALRFKSSYSFLKCPPGHRTFTGRVRQDNYTYDTPEWEPICV